MSAPKLFKARGAWDSWLADHHESADEVWVKFAKKASGKQSVSYAEALEGALCYGWIDGLVRRFDDDFYIQRFTPRRAKSKWSKINREKATALIKSGDMKPAGLRQVDAAKADGRWEAAYDSPSRVSVPDDLQRELDKSPAAAEFFAGLDSQNRYAILYGIQNAKKPETRARRIAKYVALLKARKRIRS